jgi:hypothetical protein
VCPDSLSAEEIVNPKLAGKDRADSEDRAGVETFTIQVSPDKQLAATTASRAASEATVDGEKHWVAPQAIAELPDQPISTSSPKRRFTKRSISRTAVSRPHKAPRWTSAWFISLVAHAVCVFAISLITVAAVEKLPEMTMAFNAAPQMPDEINLDQISSDVLGEVAGDDVQLASAIGDFGAEPESDLASDTSLIDFAGGIGDGPLGAGPPLNGMSGLMDATGLFGAAGGGTGGSALGQGIPSGDKLTASFFGTKVDGRRILYVLDNSGGMQDGGLEALVMELLRSVESLNEKQEFYVLFYSDMVYPMFHPRGVERFVPANDRFKQRLKVWLDSVEFCVGNSVDEAIQAAAMIRPDAAYLLTDGDINTTRDGRKLAALLDTRGREFPIHTFLIGNSSKAAENLRLVAEANKGTFRTVEVTPEAKARAKQLNRPYHNKEPGRDWGLNVGHGWGR